MKIKTIVFWVSLLVLGILLWQFGVKVETKSAYTQIYGTNYLWQDAISITTSPIDSAFAEVWQQVTVWARGCDLYAKFGAPDTTDWDSRDWIYFVEGSSVSIGSATKLTRVEFKAVSGTGTLYMFGYKRIGQY